MRRFLLLLVVPPLLAIGLAVLPLALGDSTLILRDVFSAHLPFKVAQTEALRQGELPLIDLHRSGGQPLLGNPNGLPLYPDNLLLLVADPLWALNAHFWIHWLLAPFSFFWLARALGLSRPAAWTAGIFYATGGYFFSLLNLYNLVGVAALVPAFVAAGLDAAAPGTAAPEAAPPRPRRWPFFGLIFGLLLLAGDPFSVVLALLLLAAGLLLRGGAAGAVGSWRPLAAALGLGFLVTLPMWVEMARILPFSFRASTSGVTAAALTQSLHPRHLIEAVFPLFFGRFDSTFWGRAAYDQGEPLLISLFPGLLALALVPLAFGSPQKLATRFAWLATLLGLFCAFGRFNPAMALLYQLPGTGVFRFPVKFLLLAAIGLALLGGLGCERLLATGAWRRPRPWLWLALAAYAAVFLLVILAPSLLDRLLYSFDAGLPPALVEIQRGRLGATALLLALTATALLLATLLARRSPRLALGAFLLLQAGTQVLLLESLHEKDDAAFYRTRPALDARLPAGARIAQAYSAGGALGPIAFDWQPLPDKRLIWLARCTHEEMSAPFGIYFGRQYELNFSPEGLDSYYSVFFAKSLDRRGDAERLRLLGASGVDVVILPRRLAGEDAAGAVVSTEAPSLCNPEGTAYRLERTLPPAALLGGIRRAGSAGEALELLLAPDFDPRVTAVLPARDGAMDRDGPPGEVLDLREEREAVVATVDSPAGGVFVTRRAFLPLYRAEIDGLPAMPEILNGHRLGIEVPAGRHQVRLYVDRRPTLFSFAVAALALAALLAWTLRAR